MADLSAKKRKAIRGILACSTLAKAAKFAGVGERTVYRYLANDDFRQALREESDKLTLHLSAALAGRASDALATLVTLHKDAETPPAVRRSAAASIISERRKAGELDELAARVAALEDSRK